LEERSRKEKGGEKNPGLTRRGEACTRNTRLKGQSEGRRKKGKAVESLKRGEKEKKTLREGEKKKRG